MYFVFLVPMAIIIIFNTIVFCMVTKVIVNRGKNMSNRAGTVQTFNS